MDRRPNRRVKPAPRPLAALSLASNRPAETAAPVVRYTYEVVRAYPHDRAAFTQGLIWRDGMLYESTGLYGRSSLREVAPETGEVRRLDHH